MTPVACFPALDARLMFSRPWHDFHVFPRILIPVECFPALNAGFMFSCAWQQLHDFPRLSHVPCFPALDRVSMFSRAWHQLHVFPRLTRVSCFPTLHWHGYNLFPRRKLVTFPRAWHGLLATVRALQSYHSRNTVNLVLPRLLAIPVMTDFLASVPSLQLEHFRLFFAVQRFLFFCFSKAPSPATHRKKNTQTIIQFIPLPWVKMAQSVITWNLMGVDLGETWDFIEVSHTFLCNFPTLMCSSFLMQSWKVAWRFRAQ